MKTKYYLADNFHFLYIKPSLYKSKIYIINDYYCNIFFFKEEYKSEEWLDKKERLRYLFFSYCYSNSYYYNQPMINIDTDEDKWCYTEVCYLNENIYFERSGSLNKYIINFDHEYDLLKSKFIYKRLSNLIL